MAQKISWTELRRLIATRAGVSEKNAGIFLANLNAQVIEALRTEKQVRINGLGTFKLQAVAPRKSVNIATGEEITIPGYNKVVFAPEASVKELVEKSSEVTAAPKAKAKAKSRKPKATAAAATATNDPLEKLGVQAAEIVDILGELGQNPNEEKKPAKKASPKTEKKEEKKVAIKPKRTPKPKPVAEPEPEKAEEPIKVEEPVAEPVVVQEVQVTVTEPAPMPFIIPEEKTPEPEPEQPKKKHHFWRDTLICVIILLILAGVAYYFFRHEIHTWIKDFIDKNKTEQVKEGEEQTKDNAKGTASFTEENGTVDAEGIVAGEGAETAAPEVANDESAETIIIEEQVYKKMLKTEAITEGSRLAWISKKYYGSKIYWPYLYDANKDHLRNPNLIIVGTPIRVPKLTALQKDTTNAQTMATIDHLRREAEKAMR